MIYCNFLQGINTQNRIWSSLWQRTSSMYSEEIYFVFFLALFHFRCILKICNNLWNYKRKRKMGNRCTVLGHALAQGLGGAAWPSREIGLSVGAATRAERGHHVGVTRAVARWRARRRCTSGRGGVQLAGWAPASGSRSAG
jgi:hypothetical protein